MAKCIKSPNFLWKIENFTSGQKKMCTPVSIEGLKCQLTFSCFVEAGVEKIRLILEWLRVPEMLSTFQFMTSVYFLNDNGSTFNLKSAAYTVDHKELCVWADSVSNFFKNYNKRDDITFLVQIYPTGKPGNLFNDQRKIEEDNNESLCVKSLTDEFGKLFNNDEHSDFILKCGDKSFYVHKGVLSARSDYFSAMFRCNMKESDEGTAKFEDLEPDIVELVLRYMYTGEISKMSMETLKKVYVAADRFAVEPLKVKCHSLFVDDFINYSENDSNKGSEKESEDGNGQTEVVKTVSPKNTERQLLKELFMTREWGLFCQEFPYKAQEMCKPYLLEK